MAFSVTPQQTLGSLCGLLALGCAYELWAPLPTFALPSVPAPVPVEAAAPLPSAAPPPSSAFDVIENQPIFTSDRKPLVPSAAGPAAPPPPPAIALVGIILDPTTKLALIRSPNSPLATAYAEGASIDGWILTQIAPDKIVLQAGTATDEVSLAANRAPAAPSSAMPGQPPGLSQPAKPPSSPLEPVQPPGPPPPATTP